MTETNIITNQYVQIDRTPAGIGERIFARILDYLIMAVYLAGLYYLFDLLSMLRVGDEARLTALFLFSLPVIGYSFFWEMLNHGQSPGKKAFGLRVVMCDGTTPAAGAYFLRWLLLIPDTFAWTGVIVILLNSRNQRLGDLAAGTVVIKERDYRRIRISLDEFDYLSGNYRPVFPQAENLSPEQVETISETLRRRDAHRQRRIAALARKVKAFLRIDSSLDDETFLLTLVRDCRYYALEEI